MKAYAIQTKLPTGWEMEPGDLYASKIQAELERATRGGKTRIIEYECTHLREIPEEEMQETRDHIEQLSNMINCQPPIQLPAMKHHVITFNLHQKQHHHHTFANLGAAMLFCQTHPPESSSKILGTITDDGTITLYNHEDLTDEQIQQASTQLQAYRTQHL